MRSNVRPNTWPPRRSHIRSCSTRTHSAFCAQHVFDARSTRVGPLGDWARRGALGRWAGSGSRWARSRCWARKFRSRCARPHAGGRGEGGEEGKRERGRAVGPLGLIRRALGVTRQTGQALGDVGPNQEGVGRRWAACGCGRARSSSYGRVVTAAQSDITGPD